MDIEFIQQFLGFLVGTSSSLFATWIWLRRRKKLREKLAFLEDEKNLVIKISSSGISYVRYTIQSIMYALAIICVANMIPIITKIFETKLPIPASLGIELATWGAAATVLFKNWHIGSVSYKENAARHIAKIDKKIAKTKEKLVD
ncbi:hypothetical protein [Vibrio cholerae]|uniref:hypothetical protein n=1 Tax=Vibrio cholerae TaxID=666 RepID=UPI001157FCF8|nr:hypothetical protein [Vibrio cholerae]TQP19313.1 hypothetical protein FLM00_19735 [Vibrio cholerae]